MKPAESQQRGNVGGGGHVTALFVKKLLVIAMKVATA